ncbi:MAG: transposase, partial [Bryobacteraceae bacterium]
AQESGETSTRRPARRPDSDVVAALGKLHQGMSVDEICEAVGITRRTFYAWKGKFGNLGASELAELDALREENRILRRWSATLTLLARSVQ